MNYVSAEVAENISIATANELELSLTTPEFYRSFTKY
jgi:hypothetical protein